jgi:hypothetical protein
MINSKDILKFINGDHSKSDEIEIYLKELLTLRTINQIPYSSSLKSNNDIADIESLSYFNIITLLIGISERKINSKKDFNNIFFKEIRPLINLLRLDIPEHYGLLILYNLCNGNERTANLYMNFYIAGKEHYWEFQEIIEGIDDDNLFYYDYREEVELYHYDDFHINKYLNSDNWTDEYINFYLKKDIGTFILDITDIKLLISLANETRWEDPFIFLKYKVSLINYFEENKKYFFYEENKIQIEEFDIDLLNINFFNWIENYKKLLKIKKNNSDNVQFLYNYFFLYCFQNNNENYTIEIVKQSHWLYTEDYKNEGNYIQLFINNINYINENKIFFSFSELYNLIASECSMSSLTVNYVAKLVFEIVHNYDVESNSSKLIIDKKELLFTGFIKYLLC